MKAKHIMALLGAALMAAALLLLLALFFQGRAASCII